MVLTASRSAYLPGDVEQGASGPESVPVYRARAIDTARHLALFGKYPEWLALPDRWVSWWPHAVSLALRINRRYRPDAIVTTYPVATAHLIGLAVHRLTGIPWIADFRDPMIDEHYPPTGPTRSVRQRLERATLKNCTRATFTSPSTRDLYASRYPEVPDDRLAVVMNGYDEDDFEAARAGLRPHQGAAQPLVLIHSGVLYPDVRDPSAFFSALRRLKSAGEIDSASLRVVLRACGPEAHHQRLIREHGIEDIVQVQPGIPYVDALREMMTADGLMLFQGEAANRQIPAKLFEYLRSGRPILAFIHPAGDPARLLGSLRTALVAGIDSVDEIERAIRLFIRHPERRGEWSASLEQAERYSRTSAAAAFSRVLADACPRAQSCTCP